MTTVARIKLARDAAFYPVFGTAMSLAVPVLGLYVVFALLIAPALWTRREVKLPACTAIAVAACCAALLLSAAFDWPTGACVAVLLCVVGVAAVVRAPRDDEPVECSR